MTGLPSTDAMFQLLGADPVPSGVRNSITAYLERTDEGRGLVRDAGRWRYVREAPDSEVLLIQDEPAGYNGWRYVRIEFAWMPIDGMNTYSPGHFDAAVDAAIAAQEKQT